MLSLCVAVFLFVVFLFGVCCMLCVAVRGLTCVVRCCWLLCVVCCVWIDV